MTSDKIQPHHLERKAILYVRQSSAHQVLHNRESRTLQYGMRDRLSALGFSEIETIDEDLGRSAAGGAQRTGFERMVAEVCLGKVGAVCAREVSRFARNSRDWQQLIEMCRVVDTVLVDQETVYAPRHGNDRLLLGLKGMTVCDNVGRPVPFVVERVRVDLGRLKVSVDRREPETMPVYFKSRYLPKDHPGLEKQAEFEAAMKGTNLFAPDALEPDWLSVKAALVGIVPEL